MRIVLLGPPGSGKGTQGDLLRKKYGFPRISTGDLLRKEVQDRTALGKKAESSMGRGELVSDALVMEMVKQRVSRPDCRRGYILDGFPRNRAQALKLEEMDRRASEIAIDIHLSEQTLVRRLTSRRICSGCGAVYNWLNQNVRKRNVCDACGGALIQRKDDTPEVIKERLRVYREQTVPLIDYYKKKKVYHRVNGEGRIETIFDTICSLLDREMARLREVEATR